MNAVNKRFHDLVEHFEPGVHQFFPLKLFRKDGSPLDDDYYIFNCAVGIDAIIHTNKEPKWTMNSAGKPRLYTHLSREFEISRPAVGDQHLWCGKSVAQRDLFVSDAFYQAMRRNRIQWIQAVHRREVDVPWIRDKELAPLVEWEKSRH